MLDPLRLRVAVAALTALGLVGCGAEDAEPRVATETPLGVPAPDWAHHVWVEGDVAHVAEVRTANGKSLVVIDGRSGEPYDAVRSNWGQRGSDVGGPGTGPVFFSSPDGKHLAHPVIDDDRWSMVWGERPRSWSM